MIPQSTESLSLAMKSGASSWLGSLIFTLSLRISQMTCNGSLFPEEKKKKHTTLQPSISMNIFHIQTIKASGLSIRLKAVKLLAKRDVSVSHNLMYTFRQFHGSLSSSSFFFIWDPFQPPSPRPRLFIWP